MRTNNKYFAGVDVGFVFSKAVIVKSSKIISSSIILSGNRYVESSKEVLKLAVDNAGISMESLDGVASTGFGAALVPFKNCTVSGMRCQAQGIRKLIPEARTIIEISSQNSRVIRIDKDGRIIGFNVSEKCASTGGRILTILANIMGMEVNEMCTVSSKAGNSIKFTNSCSVFLETEIISRISEGEKTEKIIAGVYEVICTKIVGMINKLELEEACVLTGGVARCKALVRALENKLGLRLFIPREPNITAAMGAAFFAQEMNVRGHV